MKKQKRSKKLAFEFMGAEGTFIKVFLLHKAKKRAVKEDVIRLEIKSEKSHIEGDMTEEEALVIINGLINAITLKMVREKRI